MDWDNFCEGHTEIASKGACLVQVMTQAGPWHARLLQLGEEHMEALRQEFMAPYANVADKRIEHYPHARLLLIRKRAAAL